MIIDVHVITNAKKDSITYTDSKLLVRTTEPPSRDKANKRILELISRALGCRAQIISGYHSKNKRILLDEDNEDLKGRLEGIRDAYRTR